MNEATIIKTLVLPAGQRWALYADANIIALSPDLNLCERAQALDEVCAHWRRSTPRFVPDDEPTVTRPLASLPPVSV